MKNRFDLIARQKSLLVDELTFSIFGRHFAQILIIIIVIMVSSSSLLALVSNSWSLWLLSEEQVALLDCGKHSIDSSLTQAIFASIPSFQPFAELQQVSPPRRSSPRDPQRISCIPGHVRCCSQGCRCRRLCHQLVAWCRRKRIYAHRKPRAQQLVV